MTAAIVSGTLNAQQWQTSTGSNDGIAKALAQCTSGTACHILLPPTYSATEAALWTAGLPGWYSMPTSGPKSSQPLGAVIQDMRYGVPQWYINGGVDYDYRHPSSPTIVMSQIRTPNGRGTDAAVPLALVTVAYDGMRNTNEDKTNLTGGGVSIAKYAEAQTGSSWGAGGWCLGNGDCVGFGSDTIAYGGPNAGSDEGNESTRWEAIEGGQVFSGTISVLTTASDGTLSLSTTSQAYNGYQGAGRMLIDLTQAYNGVAHSNYIANISNNGVFTCGGTCDWDSTFGTSVVTSLSTAVSNGSSSTNVFPISPYTLTVASTTGMSVGQNLCIFYSDYECEKITAVGSSTSVTVGIIRGPFAAGAVVAAGGLAGYGFEAEADRVTPSNLNGVANMPDSKIVSTVRLVVPIMYNATGNTFTTFGGYNCGSCSDYAGRAYPQMGSGGTVTLTITSGVVTSCTASGGTGYYIYNSGAPPQISITGSRTTAPSVYVSTVGYSGAIGGCVVASGGTGITTATATVVPYNPYEIYPAAVTASVYNATAGKVDGSFTSTPSSGTFAVGDVIEQPHWYAQHSSGLFSVVGQYQPALAYEHHAGGSITMVGYWRGGDTAFGLTNAGSQYLYSNWPGATPQTLGLGQALPPNGLTMSGSFRWGLEMDTPPFGYNGYSSSAVYVGCGVLACSSWTTPYALLSSAGVSGQNALEFTPATNTFGWYGGTLGLHFTTTPTSTSFATTGLNYGGVGTTGTVSYPLAMTGDQYGNSYLYQCVTSSTSNVSITCGTTSSSGSTVRFGNGYITATNKTGQYYFSTIGGFSWTSLTSVYGGGSLPSSSIVERTDRPMPGITLSSASTTPTVRYSIGAGTTGGSLAAGTYYYTMYSMSPFGHTIASGEQSVTTTTNTSYTTMHWYAIPGTVQDGYYVCRGTSSGGELLMTSGVGTSTADPTDIYFTDLGTATPSGACPTTNTFEGGNVPTFSGSFTAGNIVSTATSTTGLPMLVDSGVIPPTKISASLTPAAATASSCVEQTFTVSGVASTATLLAVNPPAALGAHVWLGSYRVSATNTAALQFCADATAGTPPSGSWKFVVY